MMPFSMAALLGSDAVKGMYNSGGGGYAPPEVQNRLDIMNQRGGLGNPGGGPGLDGGPVNPGPGLDGGPLTFGKTINPMSAPGALADAISRIGMPPMPSPGQLPGAVSGEQLLGLAPGIQNLPGVGGFTSLMDSILGFGSDNGYGGMNQQDWIMSQVGQGTPGAVNPYASLFGGTQNRQPAGGYYG